MKKMILCAGALMIGAVAMAQVGAGNTTTEGTEADFQEPQSLVPNVDVTSIEDADTLPQAAFGANSGYSTQTGTNNSMVGRQEGTFNSIVGDQSGDGNLASIRQTGVNFGVFSAFANDAQVQQIGQSNDARMEQQGDLNDARVRQENAIGAVGNMADIQQGNADRAENNYALVDQGGAGGNSARVLQTWDNSDALVRQFGDSNKADVLQQADPENSEGHEAMVEQLGDDNGSRIRQLSDGATGRNYARTFQEGNNNASDQLQTTTGGAGEGNDALVNQGGNFLFSDANSQAQYGVVNGVLDITNGAVSQESFYSEAIQDQMGTNNMAETHQFGAGTNAGNGDYSKQVQNGDANEAYAFQNVEGSASGRGNELLTTQVGDGNYVATGQNGRNNDITVNQQGNDNYAVSAQRGRGHTVDALQTGNMNALETAQRGVGNSIVSTQEFGQSWKADQNVPDGAPNGGNSLDIFQTSGTSGTLPGYGVRQTAAPVTRDALLAPRMARSASGL